MEIVINHLTRMEKGYFCAAGVDSQTKRHIRPETRSKRLGTAMLAPCGMFDIGNRIIFKYLQPWPDRPHSEDCIFDSRLAALDGTMPAQEFWELLWYISESKLKDVFGEELRRKYHSSCGTDKGKGQASLGCLVPEGTPNLHVGSGYRGTPQVRMKVCDGEFDLDLSVTDIRLYQDDHITPDHVAVDMISEKIHSSESVILSVGLGRAFPRTGPDRFHYLQVNNIHLKENPLWQLG